MAQYKLYSTRGRWAGLLVDGYLYNEEGCWIGWVERDSLVYNVRGDYVGVLQRDFRVLRRRSTDTLHPARRLPPAQRPPIRVVMPATAPLAPMMSEPGTDTVDVFDERPELLPPVND